MKKFKLLCTGCGKDHTQDRLAMRCSACSEPLEYEEAREGSIRKDATSGSVFDKYADFLPFDYPDSGSSLGEGFTSLVEARELAEEIGILQLYLKNETQNPTWSFKDRGTASCIRHALELGYTRVGTVSSGNMGASVAAYGAKSRLETFVIVDDIVEEKLNPIAIYGPHLLRVRCDRSDLMYRSLEIGARRDIYFSNSDTPMRIEGYKTIAYELCEQVNFDVPDMILTPTSSGGNIRGIEKGFREFYHLGLIDRLPRFVAVQPLGCCPIHLAHSGRSATWKRWEHPDTLAWDIVNTAPYSGNQVLRMLDANGGLTVAVSDNDMLQAQRSLAKTGIFVQPESAATYAALRHLKQKGEVGPDSRAACILTSSGLKFTGALAMHNLRAIPVSLEGLDMRIADIIRKGYTSLPGVS